MVRCLLFGVFLVGFSIDNVYSQALTLIFPERDMTFTKRAVSEEDSAYYFVAVTEVVEEVDGTAYYFQVQIDTAGEFCETDTSFIGRKVLLQDNAVGTHVFFNQTGDSIFIQSVLDLDSTWRFFTFEDGSFVKAEITNKIFKPIMPGVDDTIYRVKLGTFDALNNPLPGIWPDGFKFDISQNWGLAELYNFYEFPNDQDLILLRGISNPDTAITDVDAQSAHTFKSGYEFHYEEFLGNGDLDVHRLYKYFIQSIDVGADIASYTVQRTLWQETTGAGLTPDTLRILDTIDINYTFTDYAVLDTLELRYASDGFVSNGFNDFVRDTAFYNGVSHKWVYLYYGVDFTADTCMEIMFPPDPQPYFIYGQGLGIMLARDTNYYPVYPDDLELELFGRRLDMVYFQQGLITWGDPIDFSQYGFVGIQNPILATLNVYPNPATDRLYFDLPSEHIAGTIRISDLRGRNLLETPASASLDVANLKPGMYAWQLATPEVIYSGTFIKQ